MASPEAATTPPNAWTAFWRTVTRFESGKATPWLALRSAIGIGVPLVAGAILGSLPAGLAVATGSLNVTFSDSHEPYRQRAWKMLAASVSVAVAVAAGGLCGRDTTAAVAVTGLGAFAAGLLVALSTAAADLGSVTLVVLIVYAAVPMGPERAALAGLLALGGGLFQTALGLAFWPLQPYAPERRALGDLYTALSRTAAAPVRATEAPPATAQSTEAQTSLATLNRDHSIEAERYRLLLSQAERIRLSLLALARLGSRLKAPAASESELVERYLAAAAPLLASIALSLQGGRASNEAPTTLGEVQGLAAEMRQRESRLAPEVSAAAQDARRQMDALNGQFRAAADLAAYATPEGLEAFARNEARKPRRLRVRDTVTILRANLHLQSAAFRHAVRLAACVALGEGLGRGLELHRSYWLPMTLAIVLKPDFTATFSRGVLRLAGTFAGLVVATLLFHLLPAGVTTEIVLIVLLMYVLRWLGAANYGIFVIAVTALVVMLVALTGVPPKEVIAARGINTAAGGAIALAAYWLWPTWERTQISEVLARMLDAYREYFRAIRESYVHPERTPGQRLDRMRLAGRLARSNVEASIDRVSTEPGTAAEELTRLSGVLASARRLAHALMALDAGLASSHPVPARAAFVPFANDVEVTLYSLAAALRGSPLDGGALPDLREDHRTLANSGDSLTERYALVNVETDRITNSLNTLRDELLRWIEIRR